jgi:hypothetical protein
MLYRRDGERTLVGGCSKPGGSPAAGPLVIRGVPGVGSLAFASTRASARRTCWPMRLSDVVLNGRYSTGS